MCVYVIKTHDFFLPFSNKVTTVFNSPPNTHTLFFFRIIKLSSNSKFDFLHYIKKKKKETHLPSFILPELTSIKINQNCTMLFTHPLK